MKTAGRETPNRWAKVSSNRANGAVRQNTSCSFKWAEKQENFQPSDECFFLTSPFIEHFYFAQTGHSHFAATHLITLLTLCSGVGKLAGRTCLPTKLQ